VNNFIELGDCERGIKTKPNTKLKQWCWDKAILSMGTFMPFIGDSGRKYNTKYFIELGKRADFIHRWIK